MVTGRVGAWGNTNRTGPIASSASSWATGTKSLPSAPRPCSTITLARGASPVWNSRVWRGVLIGKLALVAGLLRSFAFGHQRIGQVDRAGVVVVLEDLAVARPFDRGAQHALGLLRPEVFAEHAQEGLLGQRAGALLLQAVAHVRDQRHVLEELVPE